MTLQEILKSQGLSEEQIQKIVGEMKQNKIFTASEENLDAETEEDAPAITVYLKKDTSVETERESLSRKTNISVDKHYTVALTNESKVVLAKIKA